MTDLAQRYEAFKLKQQYAKFKIDLQPEIEPIVAQPVIAPASSLGVDINPVEKVTIDAPKPIYETVWEERTIPKYGDVVKIPVKRETEESKAVRKKFIDDLAGRTELPPLEYETKRIAVGHIKGETQFATRRFPTLDSRYKRALAEIGRPLTLDEMEAIGGKDVFLNNVATGLKALKNISPILQKGVRENPGETAKALVTAAPKAAWNAFMLAAGGPADRRKAKDFFVQDPLAVLDIAAGLGMAALPFKAASAGVAGVKAARTTLKTQKSILDATRGIVRPSLAQSAKAVGQAVIHGATREFSHLPNTPQFEPFRFALQNFRKQRGITSDKTIDDLDRVVKELSKDEYTLFSDKLVVEDIKEQFDIDPNSALGPWDDDIDGFNKFYNETVTKADANPKVVEAIERRRAVLEKVVAEYDEALKEIGFDVSERLKRKEYFHRIVQDELLMGGGIKTPVSRGFLKKRTGNSVLYNTDYLQSEYHVLSQMKLDTEVAKMLKFIDEKYNIGGKIEDAPDGYVELQPREGRHIFTAETLSHRAVEDLHIQKLNELFFGDEAKGISVTPDDLRNVMALGRKRKTFIVPKEIKDTIEELASRRIRKEGPVGVMEAAAKSALTKWKAWTLLSPRRFVKYNLRNMTGDADFAFAGNPAGFKQTPRAATDLYNYFRRREASPDLQEWIDRGGLGSTMQVQEIGDLNGLDRFRRFSERPNIPTDIARRYWRGVRMTTDYREGILRYANYLDYKRQMLDSPDSAPMNFGASVKENVMALGDVRDRAFALSNDLLGAYDRVSVIGQALREYIYPFWSWKEVNIKRYIQAARNAASDGKTAMFVGKSLAGKALRSPYMALHLGRFAVKASAMQASLTAWNNMVMGDLEDKLPNSVRGTSHIVLGQDKNGEIIYFNRMGAMNDALEWIGLDAAPLYFDRISKGQMTFKQMAGDMAKAPVNVMVQGVRPDVKTGIELITRQSLFPDVFNPRAIRDRVEHISRVFGLEHEYRALTGKPSEKYLDTFSQLAVYKVNPGEAAFRNLWDAKIRYMNSIGKGAMGFWVSDKGNALYHMKQSLRYRDPLAFAHYMNEYVKHGGTRDGFARSAQAMHPLNTMSEADQEGLMKFLGEGAEEMINSATQYYHEVLEVDEDFRNKVREVL